MERVNAKQEIISQLRKEILLLEGFKPVSEDTTGIGLGIIEASFPNSVFPIGALHEFIIPQPEQAAASGGFIGGLLNVLMQQGGSSLWISKSRQLFPPALKIFGIEPHRIIFIDLQREKDTLWVMEEALKCQGLSAVIAELKDLSFAESRRLQLAVEKSRVTGFILKTANIHNATACVARWQIKPIPSELEEGLPGLGFPRWNVDLLKVRNGNPGSWKVEWLEDHFEIIPEKMSINEVTEKRRKVG